MRGNSLRASKASLRFACFAAVSAALLALCSCIPLPIVCRVNSVCLKGKLADEVSGEPIQGGHVIIECGSEKTLLSNADGSFEGSFGGNWRFIYLWQILPWDHPPRPLHIESVGIFFWRREYYPEALLRDYRAEKPTWIDRGGYTLPDRTGGRTKEIDLGVVRLKPRLSQ